MSEAASLVFQRFFLLNLVKHKFFHVIIVNKIITRDVVRIYLNAELTQTSKKTSEVYFMRVTCKVTINSELLYHISQNCYRIASGEPVEI